MSRPHSRIIAFGLCNLLALTIIACGGSARFVIRPMKIDGRAMEPALKHGDRILISRDIEKLSRGDVIIYYSSDKSRFFVHRIVGLPNEVFEVRAGQVFIDGNLLEEPYVDPANRFPSMRESSQRIPEGTYFAMGDNRSYSAGSRAVEVVPKEYVYGKLLGRYWKAGS